ncbi:41289_t:CDS:10 [Gigaspora margarita]|uniref:41289_t:CDS:1 n=1 Tax=Gigaspora margarita TaxID=4874 RepID=A0ABN7UFP8_GIGMA|nr:41289_t:CDS:10 [Gigaspora margarita]
MTCEHINRVMNKIGDLASNLNNKNSFFYQELGPYEKSEDISSSDSMRESLKNFLKQYKDAESFTIKVIRSDALGSYILEMLRILEECDCYNEAVRKTTDKATSIYQKEYDKLSRNSDVDDYNELLRKHRVLEEKCKNLADKLEEYEEYKDKFEDVRDGRERERIDNTREITALQRDKTNLQGQLTRTQQRLTASENKLARIEDRFETKNREVLELRGKLERLSINVNNLEKSREELLNEKVNLKKEKLEVFANNLGINPDEIDNLLRYYERLIQARKNYNQVNIETHEGNINRVKGIIRQGGVSVENTNKCCRKCEKVAKLRIELNEIRQQQYEARQEEFYKILEINENATQEELKKAYRKLKEREQANKKMQEINRAYEVLGNEELRKRYDLGETEFTFETSEFSYSYEEELKNISDELKRLREEQKILARKDVINMVDLEMLITEIFPRQLDKKVWKIEIGDDDINEYGIDTRINNPYFDKTKIRAIKVIEEAMKEKGLKAENLGEYSNYKEQINNLDRQWKIHNLRDKIEDYIRQQDKQDKQDKQEIEIEKLKKIIDNLKSQNNQTELAREVNNLKQLVQQLEKEVQELRDEIKELKKENDNNPEFSSYLTRKESELQSKQSKLDQLRGVIETNNESKPRQSKSDSDDLSIGLVAGIGIFVVLGLLAVLILIDEYNRLVEKYNEEMMKGEEIRYYGGQTQEQERIKRELDRKMEEKQRELQECQRKLQEQDQELNALIEEIRR